MKQLELMPTPRPRVRLEPPAPLTAVHAVSVADAFYSAPKPRRRLDAAVVGPNVQMTEFPDRTLAPVKENWELDPAMAADAFLPRSAWSKDGEKPPAVGWWEVTDHKTGTLLARWWFGGVWWHREGPGVRTPGINHDEFVKQYAWRGLRQPHPDVYPCPPYASYALVERAGLLRVGILTTYVRIVRKDGVMKQETMNPPQYPTGKPRVKL